MGKTQPKRPRDGMGSSAATRTGQATSNSAALARAADVPVVMVRGRGGRNGRKQDKQQNPRRCASYHPRLVPVGCIEEVARAGGGLGDGRGSSRI